MVEDKSREEASKVERPHVSFSDHVVKIELEPLPEDLIQCLFYSTEEISQMKDIALVELESEFASAKGKDMFDFNQRPGLTMRPSSLKKMCSDRDLSPLINSSRSLLGDDNDDEPTKAIHPERVNSYTLQMKIDCSLLDLEDTDLMKQTSEASENRPRRERRDTHRSRSHTAPARSDKRRERLNKSDGAVPAVFVNQEELAQSVAARRGRRTGERVRSGKSPVRVSGRLQSDKPPPRSGRAKSQSAVPNEIKAGKD